VLRIFLYRWKQSFSTERAKLKPLAQVKTATRRSPIWSVTSYYLIDERESLPVNAFEPVAYAPD
jgi:hypothetical protein